MRGDVPAPADTTLANGASTVTLFRSATPLQLILGTAGDALDLTPLATSVRQTETDATLELRHRTELAGANRPLPGQMVQVARSDVVLFNGMVAEVSRERESRGERSMTVTVRRRDATPWWREVHRVSSLFGVGADLAAMARDVAEGLGLSPREYELPLLGMRVVHDTAQLADVTAWEMLTTILQPVLREPFVDARGMLKGISRDTRRPADLQLAWSQIASIERSGAAAPLTSVKVRWLDPNLTKVPQQEQPLATASLACGFFKPSADAEVWWSDDRRQRAEQTTMVVKSSINSGMFPVGSESYVQTSEFGGVVHARLGPWVPMIAGAGGIAALAASLLPDEVVVGGLFASSGFTIPTGRLAQQVAVNLVLTALATIGQGAYEIRGVPYDYIHTVNETEAYDQAAPPYVESAETIENDLVPDDSTARSLAVNELIFRARSAAGAALTVADDPRIEPGDVLGLPDGRRFYVNTYSRDLTRGAAPLLELGGFFA